MLIFHGGEYPASLLGGKRGSYPDIFGGAKYMGCIIFFFQNYWGSNCPFHVPSKDAPDIPLTGTLKKLLIKMKF